MVEMRYFDKYTQLVYSGKIRVCGLTMKSIKRVERYKEQYIFKQEEADKRIEFIEEECSNTKGLAGKLRLALPQKVWLETTWGFYHTVEVTKTDPDTLEEYKDFEERRLIHEVPIIVPRGTGKTTLGSAIGEVGQIIEGKVVQIKDYGAFVELEAGLDGLVHISEIANRRVENVSDELALGNSITAKIMEIDADRKRISLSIKALLGDEEEVEAEAESTEE